MKLSIPISIGELYDKIYILEIKSERITDPAKLKNVRKELTLLKEISDKHQIEEKFLKRLKELHGKLWEIEDQIRVCESNKSFGKRFINLARSVYINNDKRFEIKNKINIKYGSQIIEEKSYKKY